MQGKKRMRVVILVSVLAFVFLACISGGLPKEAKEEVDSLFAAFGRSYTITSAKKGSNPGPLHEEVWCVVTDPPFMTLSDGSMPSHLLLYRTGLAWLPTGGQETIFLVAGCNNWPTD